MNKKEQEERKDRIEGFWIFFIFGILLSFGGIVFQINNSIIVLENYKNQPSVLNSYLLFFGGLICFVCSFFLFKQNRNKRSK